MKTAFLFGAGASAFSGPCLPRNPPLGIALFDELVPTQGVFASIEPPLAALFRSDPERGTAEFAEARPGDRHKLLREMAHYFTHFAAQPGNLYHRLVHILSEHRHAITLATTNYELLVEQSVNHAGKRSMYLPVEESQDSITVLKLHGSCNLIPNLGGSRFRGVQLGNSVTHYEGPVKFVSATEARRFCEEEDTMCPSLALYAEGKAVLFAPNAVAAIQAAWRSELEGSTRVVVIGMAVNRRDAHIWDHLRQLKAPVDYVGPDPSGFEEWADGRGDCRTVAGTFEEYVTLLPAIALRSVA